VADAKPADVTVLRSDGVEITLLAGGRIISGAVERRGNRILVHWRGLVYEVASKSARPERAGAAAAAASEVFAPMTGTVIQVFAKDGDALEPGTPLLIVEAMKMEHRIVAPAKARVARIHVKSGDRVDVGAKLVSLELDGAS
jgi:3-methylcrotonyl-CoA carboxylase alpha subunit